MQCVKDFILTISCYNLFPQPVVPKKKIKPTSNDGLTHSWSKFPFYPSWKYQKTKEFLVLSEGTKMRTLARNVLMKAYCKVTPIVICFFNSIITKANEMAGKFTFISRYFPKFDIRTSYNCPINNSNIKRNIRFRHMKNQDEYDKKNNLIFNASSRNSPVMIIKQSRRLH